MKLLFELDEIRPGDAARVGGKNTALARMAAAGLPVPDTLCVGVEAYRRFVASTGLRERILLELNRKVFGEMRWEEIWDTALRIRSHFLRTPIPEALRAALAGPIQARFGADPVVVRSSAPREDAAGTSFAGLHDSFVNLRGVDAILEHIVRVWASLWTDRALLYRRELGLSPAGSVMGVAVQAIVAGEVSGVAFGVSPTDPGRAVIEAVYGLNQGLVDGDVAPDAWILDRQNGAVVTHRPPGRERAMRPVPGPGGEGVVLVPLSPEEKTRPPLSPAAIAEVFRMLRAAEALFGAPQDMEWTVRGGRFYILQSRPVTTAGGGADGADNRAWYLSQHRSLDTLKRLSERIQGVLLPRMAEAAREMAGLDPASLSDRDLAAEIARREEIHEKWKRIYWDEFIPLAHGVRLFGQAYNEAVRPDDPFEFVDLLKGAEMLGMRRNRRMAEMAAMVRRDAGLARLLASGAAPPGGTFAEALDRFMEAFGLAAWGDGVVQDRGGVIRMILSLAALPEPASGGAPAESRRPGDLERAFLSRFAGEKRAWAEEVLAVGRESYRLRDDDNLYLGRIEGHLLSALAEGRRRVPAHGPSRDAGGGRELLAVIRRLDAARDRQATGAALPAKVPAPPEPGVQARQIVGQPAGPGLARGRARVVLGPEDLFAFQVGEILVCDAVDPNMTFLVPLASAVVERRGGMLIHGAIIAREYGLPCVTGVPDAVRSIATGDEVTVDGYLGIVIRHFEPA